MTSILVLNSTGKVGQGVCKALSSANFKVFGMTRGGVKSVATVKSNGAEPVLGNYTVGVDIAKALKETGARKVFVLTDTFHAAKGKAAVEIDQGKTIIDACKAGGADFVVFSSIMACDSAPAAAKHIRSKHTLESYVKQSEVPHGILRLGCFFENLDDPSNWNPLAKRSVKMLSGKPIKYCSSLDIGKGAAAMFTDTAAYKGKTVDVVSWEGDGQMLAEALTKASGEPSKFSVGLPRFVLWLMSRDLYAMIEWFEKGGLKDVDMAPFKKMVPDAMDAEAYFRSIGKWSNGDKFASMK